MINYEKYFHKISFTFLQFLNYFTTKKSQTISLKTLSFEINFIV